MGEIATAGNAWLENSRIEGGAVFAIIDAALASLGVNGAITVKKETLALLEADLTPEADTLAVVYNDTTSANNGIYAKVGAPDTGSWAITALAIPSSFATDLATVLTALPLIEAWSATAAAAAADAEAAALVATAQTLEGLGYRDQAETARDQTLAYADLTGPFVYVPTKADADAILAGLPADQLVQVWADESEGGSRTVYKKVSDAYVLQGILDYITTSTVDTLTNKTFSGSTPFLLDGGRVVMTSSDTLPTFQPGLVHIQNENFDNVALLVNSFWEGSTGSNYVNNDCTLFVVHSNVVSDSANRSWAASLSNAYRNIPEGVTDSGEAVGVIGWASSVAIPGYQHAGTLAAQCGVRGRGGFQGNGSAATAIVQNAVGVDGQIVSESVGTTINLAIAGRFTTPGGVGVIEQNIAVYANAQNGTATNYSFYGQNGAMYNKDSIVTTELIRGKEFKFTGRNFADADGSYWNRLWDAGGGVAIRMGGNETVHTNSTHVFDSPNYGEHFAKIDASGIWANLPTYADNAAAISGGLAVKQMYATATGELRIVV